MAEFKFKKGFDINIAGAAIEKIVDLDAPNKVALQPNEFRGVKAKLDVEVGSSVKKGTPLFHDKTNPDIKFVSPVSGKVAEINRGERRMLIEVVVENDKKNDAVSLKAVSSSTKREEIVETLLKGGLWPLIRQRPFSKIANPADHPRDIFISGMDTGPLAPSMKILMEGQDENFQYGLDILKQLTEGSVYLGLRKKENIPAFHKAQNVEKNYFEGPHPAGNIGVHIHHVKPIKGHDVVWYVQPYAVALIGKSLKEGEYCSDRVVAVAGPVVKKTGYFRTTLGTPLNMLINEGNLSYPDVRYISGNVLTGRKILSKGYTGFYDSLISVVAEGAKETKLLGWFRPGSDKHSRSRTYLSRWLGKKDFNIDTLLNGGSRAFIMSGDYEQVMPMDIYPVFLAKSILVDDIEEMEGLGILEVDEEDVALCSYICPSKYDFGKLVRRGLDLIEKEG